MSLLPRSIIRWWRSHGHGVHSPFAFRLITMVLRSKGRYYSSREIESMPDSRWLRLIFNLICDFEPDSISASRFSDHEMRVIILADSRVRCTANDSEGAITMAGRNGEMTIVRDITLTPELWESLCGRLSSGMTFSNGKTGIIVSRHDLPRQDFAINF